MTNENKEIPIIINQIKYARAILAWSQRDLAERAQIAQSTVADFERKGRNTAASSVEAMRTVLEQAGITFLPTGGVKGPAPTIALKKSRKSEGKVPFRWINATDLIQWADRRTSSQSLFPELISRLISSELGQSAHLHFPSDEGSQKHGWDGACQTPSTMAHQYIPQGYSGWELTVQKERITAKADKDYKEKTNNTETFNPNTTFVFATLRRWEGKDTWIKNRVAEKKWANVVAYDADDFVHWIEQYPAVAQWLAVVIGRRPPDLKMLSEIWDEWASSTQWPLSSDVILVDRDEEATTVLRWLRREASSLVVLGESPDEAIAFLNATIEQLPPEYLLEYHSRCVVAETGNIARQLCKSMTPLIIVLKDPEAGLVKNLVEYGHHVYVVCSSVMETTDESLKLPKPNRYSIQHGLSEMGLETEKAQSIARDANRSLSVLRRLMPAMVYPIPEWAETKFEPAFLAALLVGGWDENLSGDCQVLEEIAGMPYDTISQSLAPWAARLDSPISKSGKIWKITSSVDAWHFLARRLTKNDMEKFEKAVFKVLGAPDPRFDVEPNERWRASLQGVQRPYSNVLRNGLIDTMILLSCFGDKAKHITHASDWPEYFVRELLKNADEKRWWSLSENFESLAEASPDAFFTAIEENFSQATPSISILFKEDKNGLSGRSYIPHLLWALEALAWDYTYLGRITEILARLDQHDKGDSQYQNRPKNSLRQIFLLWAPQTHATLETRLNVLDRLRKKAETASAIWHLRLKILPKGHDSNGTSPTPKWRKLSAESAETVTYGLIAKGAQRITETLLEDVGLDVHKWNELLEVIEDLAPDWRLKALQQLASIASHVTTDENKIVIRNVLREKLHHHRSFPDAQWSLPVDEIDKIEEVYTLFEPSDLLKKYEWLFKKGGMNLPNPSDRDWGKKETEAAQVRQQAVQNILDQQGLDGLFLFAKNVEWQGYIGEALSSIIPDAVSLNDILEKAVKSETPAVNEIAHSLTFYAFRRFKKTWATELLKKASEGKWSAENIARILRALPGEKWVWDYAEKFGAEVSGLYWKKVNIRTIKNDCGDEIVLAAEQLLNGKRAHHALLLISESEKPSDFSPQFVTKVLKEAASESGNDEWNGNDATMFEYYVGKAFSLLRQTSDFPEDEMARLEFIYLPLLKHRRQSPLTLHKVLSSNPDFFVEVICAMFKPEKESGIEDSASLDSDAVGKLAARAFDILNSWDTVPGRQANGEIDSLSLEKWVKGARAGCAKMGRKVIGDQQIGQVLASAPSGKDGIWPEEAVREVIETVGSNELEKGICIGVYNNRGVTTRDMLSGGKQERDLAQFYRKQAKEIASKWSRTAAVLERIAKDYERQAKHFDEDAERDQW